MLQANNYIDINAKSNFTTKTAAQHTEMADSKYSEIETTYEVNAKNEIIHQVGGTKSNHKWCKCRDRSWWHKSDI
ncbi:hypothetical protein QM027_01925 [Campylobacter concisus]